MKDINDVNYNLLSLIEEAREWSAATFGPDDRALGVIDHIRKELDEIAENPSDLLEWIDVIILAIDGAWRQGYEPKEIVTALNVKYELNRQREWPDWRTADPNKAIEHVRTDEEASEGGGRVAEEGDPNGVSSASDSDESESRERLVPIAATPSGDSEVPE